ncbi:MAG: DUF192 domain-containing protein [Alphaproteobacteria bacterium]|nr:DUF192 domain-containing protein [Alphaproteobacteria bacterium]
MNRRAFIALAACIALAAPAAAVVTFEKSELTIESDGKSHHFTIEIARTPEQSQQGLMFRAKMAADAGMLFLYDPPQPVSMWMYQTILPLDMLFIGADGKVVNIRERAVPGSTDTIPSAGPVRAVLELNGGTVARLKLKPGDRVRHAEIAR